MIQGTSDSRVGEGYEPHGKEHLFKYSTASSAISIINNYSMRWSSPLTFNDPFDCRSLVATIPITQFDCISLVKRAAAGFDFNTESNDSSRGVHTAIRHAISLIPDVDFTHGPNDSLLLSPSAVTIVADVVATAYAAQYQAITERTNNSFEEGMSRVKVVCLSEIKDNLLMWSHYARRHTGVVIELDCNANPDSSLSIAQPVKYRELFPYIFDEVASFEVITGTSSFEDLYKNFSINMIVEKCIYTKSDHWEHELEWRLAILDHDDATASNYADMGLYPGEISAIYIGCNMSPLWFDRIVTTLKSSDHSEIKLYWARKKPYEFGLYFTQVDY